MLQMAWKTNEEFVTLLRVLHFSYFGRAFHDLYASQGPRKKLGDSELFLFSFQISKAPLEIAMSTRSPCFTERGISICLKQLSSGRLGGFRSLANPRVGVGLWFCQIGNGDRTPFGGVNPVKSNEFTIEIAAFFFNGTKLSHTHTTKWVPLDKTDFTLPS